MLITLWYKHYIIHNKNRYMEHRVFYTLSMPFGPDAQKSALDFEPNFTNMFSDGWVLQCSVRWLDYIRKTDFLLETDYLP